MPFKALSHQPPYVLFENQEDDGKKSRNDGLIDGKLENLRTWHPRIMSFDSVANVSLKKPNHSEYVSIMWMLDQK